MLDILQLYSDHSLDYKTEGHKHTRPGWVNIPCPHCSGTSGHDGYHLGYNLQNDFFVCWRCGSHPVSLTIAKLLKVSEYEARELIKQYGLLIPHQKKETVRKIGAKPFRIPSNTEPLTERHKKYLEKRNFDPEYLEREWNLLSTGPVSLLDHLDYSHRILIPFYWDDVQVSFDSRDVTNKAMFKYMACPAEREIISHKDILYGKQSEWKETGIIVEGPTDVWRFGPLAAATSGIKYTPKQVRLIASSFKRVWICFDANESQALEQMYKLRGDLRFRGCDAQIAFLDEGDPGSMSQEAADKFVRQLLK